MNGIVKTVDKAVHMFSASMQISLLANRTAWVHIGHTRSQWSTRRMVVYTSTRSMQCSYLFPFCTENCLDRHVEEDPNRVALIWEKDEPHQHENITYKYVQVWNRWVSVVNCKKSKPMDWACCMYISGHSKVDILKKHADRHVWWSFPDVFLVLERTYDLSELWDSPRIYHTNLSCTYHPTCSIGVPIKLSLRHQETSICNLYPDPTLSLSGLGTRPWLSFHHLTLKGQLFACGFLFCIPTSIVGCRVKVWVL